jgi:hypothetical protein
VSLDIVVVEVSPDIHPGPAQRKQGIVKVEEVGIVLIDKIARAVVEILHIGDVRL